eukprot:3624624-Pyramimonas_sp.AAC.1
MCGPVPPKCQVVVQCHDDRISSTRLPSPKSHITQKPELRIGARAWQLRRQQKQGQATAKAKDQPEH